MIYFPLYYSKKKRWRWLYDIFPSILQQGDIEMEVVFVAPDEDSDDENHEYEDENGFRFVNVLIFWLILFWLPD